MNSKDVLLPSIWSIDQGTEGGIIAAAEQYGLEAKVVAHAGETVTLGDTEYTIFNGRVAVSLSPAGGMDDGAFNNALREFEPKIRSLHQKKV